jgi:hypothetical protein
MSHRVGVWESEVKSEIGFSPLPCRQRNSFKSCLFVAGNRVESICTFTELVPM